MTIKNVRLDLSLFEILQIIVRQWKTLLLIVIVFVVLLCGYGLLQGSKSQQANNDPQSQEQYELELDLYNISKEEQETVTPIVKQKWIESVDNQTNHPLMLVDPNHCSYNEIALIFSDGNGECEPIVQNWIAEADEKQLFGEKANDLSAYKNDIIVADTENAEDLKIYIIGVDDYDTTSAAAYLMRNIKKQAEDAGLSITAMSSSQHFGYLDYVLDYQRKSRQNLNELHNTLQNMKKTSEIFTAPVNPNTSGHSVNIIKMIIIGLVLGLFVGVVLIILRAVFTGNIISRRQIEDVFELAMLGDCSNNSDGSLDILDSNLDVMTKEKNKVMVIGCSDINVLDKLTEEWNKRSERKYLTGKSIVDDPITIEKLQETDGIVVAVRLGKSKLGDLQNLVLRANKLDKRIVGFVLI